MTIAANRFASSPLRAFVASPLQARGILGSYLYARDSLESKTIRRLHVATRHLSSTLLGDIPVQPSVAGGFGSQTLHAVVGTRTRMYAVENPAPLQSNTQVYRLSIRDPDTLQVLHHEPMFAFSSSGTSIATIKLLVVGGDTTTCWSAGSFTNSNNVTTSFVFQYDPQTLSMMRAVPFTPSPGFTTGFITIACDGEADTMLLFLKRSFAISPPNESNVIKVFDGSTLQETGAIIPVEQPSTDGSQTPLLVSMAYDRKMLFMTAFNGATSRGIMRLRLGDLPGFPVGKWYVRFDPRNPVPSWVPQTPIDGKFVEGTDAQMPVLIG